MFPTRVKSILVVLVEAAEVKIIQADLNKLLSNLPVLGKWKLVDVLL